VFFFAQADLGMFSMFGRRGAPAKRGRPQARESRTAARHFLACEGLFMACCDIHSVQHDNLWPINILRFQNS